MITKCTDDDDDEIISMPQTMNAREVIPYCRRSSVSHMHMKGEMTRLW